MSEWLVSLRTTNGMRLPFPVVVSSRFRCARYNPDTAVDGTAHEADTAQLPQSMRPVDAVSFLHVGWDCGSVAVGCMPLTTLVAPMPWYQPTRNMSMWYLVDGVLILNDTVCPGVTLICVAKPWIVESPAPLTCQSAAGSPGLVFSHAITLVTGGPPGPAPAPRRASTKKKKTPNTKRIKAENERRPPIPQSACPTKDTFWAPPPRWRPFSLRNGDAPPGRVGWQDVDNKMITITMPPPRVSRPGQRGPGDGDGWAVYRRVLAVSALRRWRSCPGWLEGPG